MMTQIILANIGAATLVFLGGITVLLMINGLWRYRKVRRAWNSFANLTYRRRRSVRLYGVLAQNGYIYVWASRLLIRYKAVDK